MIALTIVPWLLFIVSRLLLILTGYFLKVSLKSNWDTIKSDGVPFFVVTRNRKSLKETITQSKVTGTPLKVTGTSLKVTGTPLKVTGTQLKVTGTPLKVTMTQLKVTGSQ